MPTPQQKPAPDFIPADPDFIPAEQNVPRGTMDKPQGMQASADDFMNKTFTDVPADGSQSHGSKFAAFMHNAGSAGAKALGSIPIHPVDTALNVGEMLFAPPLAGMQQGENIANDFKTNGPGMASAHLLGNLAAGGALGETGLRGAGMAVDSLRNFRPTPSPDIVPPLQTAAEKLAGSINPSLKRIPQFVEGTQRNAGNINDFVRRTGNPLRTQAEFEQAIKGAGDERYEHFLQHILEPNMEVPVEGTGMRAGEAHARISKINQLLDPTYQRQYPGEVDAALAKNPPDALKDEHDALVPALHDALSQATGIPPDQIASLRQDFGSLRGMGDTVQGARMGRISRVGAADEGGNAMPMSKEGVATKLWEGLRGGKQAIADRNFQKAWQGVNEASPPPPRPIPQVDPAFLRAKNLEQLSNVIPAELDAGGQSFGDRMRGMARTNAETQPQSKPFVPPVQPSEPIPRRLLQPMPEVNANYGKVPDMRPTTTDFRPIPEGFGEQMRIAARERSQMRKGN